MILLWLALVSPPAHADVAVPTPPPQGRVEDDLAAPEHPDLPAPTWVKVVAGGGSCVLGSVVLGLVLVTRGRSDTG